MNQRKKDAMRQIVQEEFNRILNTYEFDERELDFAQSYLESTLSNDECLRDMYYMDDSRQFARDVLYAMIPLKYK